MGWYSIGCVFDKEPEWTRLEALHLHSFLKGYCHKNGKLWLLDAGNGELPQDYEAFTSGWPEHFSLPENLTLPKGYQDFIEKCGEVATTVCTFRPHVLLYGAAVAALTNQRTYLWGGSDEDFDMALLLNDGKVEGFGAEGGGMEITWENETVQVQCTCHSDDPEETADEDTLQALEALPFVRMNRVLKSCEGELYRWPQRIWPAAWGKPDELLGLGTWDYPKIWREELEECYYRPGQNIVKPKSGLLPMLGKILRNK